MSYAKTTTVTEEKSRAEIEKTLERYGADQFAYMKDSTGAIIAFRMEERNVRFLMPMPKLDEFRVTAKFRQRTEKQAEEAHAQAIRSRWRGLLLIVKAKLEAIDAGISTFEREFLADIMLPNGESVHQYLAPQIEHAYLNADMPLLALPRGAE